MDVLLCYLCEENTSLMTSLWHYSPWTHKSSFRNSFVIKRATCHVQHPSSKLHPWLVHSASCVALLWTDLLTQLLVVRGAFVANIGAFSTSFVKKIDNGMTQNRAWRRHVYSPLFDETHVAGRFIIYGASNIPEKGFYFMTTLVPSIDSLFFTCTSVGI